MNSNFNEITVTYPLNKKICEKESELEATIEKSKKMSSVGKAFLWILLIGVILWVLPLIVNDESLIGIVIFGMVLFFIGDIGLIVNHFLQKSKNKERENLLSNELSLQENRAQNALNTTFRAFIGKYCETHQIEDAVQAAKSNLKEDFDDLSHGNGYSEFEKVKITNTTNLFN